MWQKTDDQLYNEASLAQSINSGTAADSPLLSVLVFVTDSTPCCEFSADHPSSSCLSRPVYDSAPCNYYKRMEPRVLFFRRSFLPPRPAVFRWPAISVHHIRLKSPRMWACAERQTRVGGVSCRQHAIKKAWRRGSGRRRQLDRFLSLQAEAPGSTRLPAQRRHDGRCER